VIDDLIVTPASPPHKAITTVRSIATTTKIETSSSIGFSFVTLTVGNSTGVVGNATGPATSLHSGLSTVLPGNTSTTTSPINSTHHSSTHFTASSPTRLSSFTTFVNTSLPGIVVGHSTVVVPSSVTISTLSSSIPVVIGPTSGHIGTDTFAIPTTPTTMTTDGATLHFASESSTSTPTTETVGPHPSIPPWSHAEKALFALDVSIDGSSAFSIPLPGQGVVEVQLPDGRSVLLSGDAVVVGRRPSDDRSVPRRDNAPLLDSIRFPVPRNTQGAKTWSRGSGENKVTVTFNPPPSPKTLPSLFDALGGLTDAASSAVGGLGSVVSSGQSLLDSGSSEALHDFAGAIDSTLTSIGDMQSTITGLQQNLAEDILAMAPPDLQELIDTVNTIRDVYDWVQSVRDTINQFKGAVDTIHRNLQQMWPGQGYFDRQRKQLRDFAAYGWKDIEPGPEQLGMYTILTNFGTPWHVYQNFIQHLDGGKGYTQGSARSTNQMYWTQLTASQARQARKHDVVGAILEPSSAEDTQIHRRGQTFRVPAASGDGPHRNDASSLLRALPDDLPVRKGALRHRLPARDDDDNKKPPKLEMPRPNSPSYLKMISSQATTGAPDTDYNAQRQLGRGQMIYVIDDGFDQTNDVGVEVLSLRRWGMD
jgi:hypothetical protein